MLDGYMFLCGGCLVCLMGTHFCVVDAIVFDVNVFCVMDAGVIVHICLGWMPVRLMETCFCMWMPSPCV